MSQEEEEEEKRKSSSTGWAGWAGAAVGLPADCRLPAVDGWAHGLPPGYCPKTSTRSCSFSRCRRMRRWPWRGGSSLHPANRPMRLGSPRISTSCALLSDLDC